MARKTWIGCQIFMILMMTLFTMGYSDVIDYEWDVRFSRENATVATSVPTIDASTSSNLNIPNDHMVIVHRHVDNRGVIMMSSTSSSRRLQQAVNGALCSSTDASASAVFACTNAVRQDPSIMSGASCYAAVQASLTTPRRGALTWSTRLATAAVAHNDRMVATDTMSHQLPGEAWFGDRVKADSGYQYNGLGENIAAGYPSARSVVSGWFCSEGHRNNMFGCGFTEIGIASRNGYYTQIFGCPAGASSCGSCGVSRPPSPSPTVAPSPSPTVAPSPSPTVAPSRYVEVRPAHVVGKCLDVQDDGTRQRVVQMSCNRTRPLQRFQLVDAGGGFTLVRDARGRCMDIQGSSTQDFARINVWPCHGGSNQQFRIAYFSSTNRVHLRPRLAPTKCVDILRASTANGAIVQQLACNSTALNQAFAIPARA